MKIIVIALLSLFALSSCKTLKKTQDTSILEQEPVATQPEENVEQPEEMSEDVVEIVREEVKESMDYIEPDQSTGRKEEVALVDQSTGEQLHNYYVIVGSFSVLDNAKNFNQTLKQKGFNSNILVNTSKYYRVSVGGHQNEQEARKQLAHIKNSFDQYKDAWLLISNK